VKAGINIWRAVRDVKESHPAWEHLNGKGITESDLPLPLSSEGCKEGMAEAEDMTARMEAMAANVMPGEYTATGTRAAAAAAGGVVVGSDADAEALCGDETMEPLVENEQKKVAAGSAPIIAVRASAVH
jgi:hypothetical protein